MENGETKCTEHDCKALLVDDDADNREFFSHALNDVGENVRLNLFSSGEDVLEELGSGTGLPDVFFLDLYMPVMGGEICLARIRGTKNTIPSVWSSIPL